MIDLLARTLGGDESAAAALSACDPAAVVDAAIHHGVGPLLHERLTGLGAGAALVTLTAAMAQRELFADLLREAELMRALDALARIDAAPVLMKGSHLAYCHYPRPELRPRVDTDVLVAPGAPAAVDTTLKAMGFTKQRGMSGELVSYQSLYAKHIDGTLACALDVHWKIANAQVFSNMLSHDEVAANAVPIPRLGPHARGLSAVHALLLACVHRMAHHLDSDRLIWLYDISLLAGRLSPGQWNEFATLAADRGVVGVCRRSLERTQERFPATAVPAALSAMPRWASPGPELSAGYLTPRRAAEAIADDLRALPDWGQRIRLLREHLFPPAQYMRTIYAPASGAPLPYLHARRIIRGAHTWLRKKTIDD